RFPSRSIPEICAMGGITVEEFSQSRIYREIVGIGEARGLALGEARGKAEEAARVTVRLLTRRCGVLAPELVGRIEALPLEQLEALAEALLDFRGRADLEAWLA
ncbi:MAG: DUF4351 domain-containing protein, partial [Cyanobacteriota bacterium]